MIKYPVLLITFLLVASNAVAAPPVAQVDEQHRAFFRNYCVACHRSDKSEGKLRLDDIPFVIDSVELADRWQKILNQLNSGDMPPEGENQPGKAEKTEFLDMLARTLVTARKSIGDHGGEITMRRLNRREYKNTIRDLLGVEINVRELPADGGAGSFDTVGSTLFMSSDQLEQYLALGRLALDEHFARFVAPTGAKPQLLHVEAEERNDRIAKSLAERTDAHERYLKWTAMVDAAAQKPENAAIATKIRAEKKNDDRHFYSQWQRIKGAPSPAEFGFVDEIHADEQGRRNWVRSVPYQRSYVEHPATKTGTFLTIEDVFVNPYQPFRIPGGWPAGDYVVRVRIAATSNTPASRHFVEFGSQHNSGVRAVASSHQITGTMEKPQVLEIPLKFSPEKGHGFFFQEKGTYESEEVAHRIFAEAKQRNGIGPEFALWIDWIEVESVSTTAVQPQKLHVEAEEIANPRVRGRADWLQQGLDQYRKWIAAVDVAAGHPKNAAKAKEIRESQKVKAYPPAFYDRWAELEDAPATEKFGFKNNGVVHHPKLLFDRYHPYHVSYLELPKKDTGAYLTIKEANPDLSIKADAQWPVGDYVLRVRIAALDDAPAERRFLDLAAPGVRNGDFNILRTHQITGTMAQPQILEIPISLTAGKSREFVLREKRSNTREVDDQIWYDHWNKHGVGPKPAMWIDWMEIEGPTGARSTSVAASDVKSQKLRKDPEQWANKYMPIYAQGYVEKYGRYEQWCAAVDAAAAKQENAAAVAKARLDPKLKTQPHLFYNHFAGFKGAPAPTQFGFRDVDDAQFARSEYMYHHRYYADYMKLPQRDTGAWLMLYSLGRFTGISASEKWSAGKYILRVRLAASDESPKERRFIEIGTGKADAADFNVLSSHKVTGTLANPQTLEIPVEINASGDRNFAIRDKRPNNRAAEYVMFREAWDKTGTGPRPCIWVDFVELEGPVNANVPTLAAPKTIQQRREVELHANAMVDGTYNGYFKGGYEAAKKFMETKQPQKSIPDEQEAKFRIRGFEQHGPTYERYLNDPLTKTGAYLTIYNVHTEEVITLPPDQPSGWLNTKHEIETAPPGEYMLRFRIGAVTGTPKERHFVVLGSRKEKDDFGLMQTFQISGTTDAPQIIEVPISISADGPRTFVLREKRDVKLDHEVYTAAQRAGGMGPASALWIDWVEWQGPLMKPSPVTKLEHIEVEKKTDELKRQITYMAGQHAKFEEWKAAGAVEADLPKFGFPTRYHADFRNLVWEGNHEWFRKYVDRPEAKTGMFLDNTINETSELVTDLPVDLPTGDYMMRVKIGRVQDMPDERAFLSFIQASPIDKDDRMLLTTKQITASVDDPEVIELPFRVTPDGPRKFILMEKRPLKKEAISLPGRTRLLKDLKQRDPILWIDWIEWSGPFNASDSKSKIEPVIFANTTGASESDHARAIIDRFASRAFRGREPRTEYVDKLTKLFETRRKSGDKFEDAIKESISVVLASPRFLYLAEPADEGRSRRLTDLELATRLAYFLWSAPPDDTLLSLARSGDLQKPEILAAQVDRLIESEKSREFVTGFVHQWLDMDRLDFFQFNTQLYRDFDESTKAAARREVYLTFEHLLRNNDSLNSLLKSDFVIINGLLAGYYGLDGVSGDEFRKVSLPHNSPRGGLLGMAAIMAMGSNGEQSSPVERGAWVLRKLLHDPPPPAPPNVPQITRLEGKLLTTRERLLAHQEEPQCASCHRKIDPIGFGLENFNAVGKWRTKDSYEKKGVGKKEWEIDPAGAFHNGPGFHDYFELRDLIAARADDFARGFTEELIEYAIGRPYGFADDEMAAQIVARAKSKDFSLREFVQALVASEAFHRK